MYKYTFNDGHVITSKLQQTELIKRMNRVDRLITLTEGYDSGLGLNICQKAVRAYNKEDNWTGIVHLTFSERDFLSYILDENSMLSDKDRNCLEYYIKTN